MHFSSAIGPQIAFGNATGASGIGSGLSSINNSQKKGNQGSKNLGHVTTSSGEYVGSKTKGRTDRPQDN